MCDKKSKRKVDTSMFEQDLVTAKQQTIWINYWNK